MYLYAPIIILFLLYLKIVSVYITVGYLYECKFILEFFLYIHNNVRYEFFVDYEVDYYCITINYNMLCSLKILNENFTMTINEKFSFLFYYIPRRNYVPRGISKTLSTKYNIWCMVYTHTT